MLDRMTDDEAIEAIETRGAREVLSERDRAVLAMEHTSWPGPGAKERAIREQLGISPVRYYQLLNALIDDERALAHDPVTVNRLRRVRDDRRSRR
jgi:DNA-directed RNA polymerase specialized sigma subunit